MLSRALRPVSWSSYSDCSGSVYFNQEYLFEERKPLEYQIFLTLISIVHEARHDEQCPNTNEADAYSYELQAFDNYVDTVKDPLIREHLNVFRIWLVEMTKH